jgi:hypothetical protein
MPATSADAICLGRATHVHDLFFSQDVFSPGFFIAGMPSSSFSTSPGIMPKARSIVDPRTNIRPYKKNRLSVSKALTPPLSWQSFRFWTLASPRLPDRGREGAPDAACVTDQPGLSGILLRHHEKELFGNLPFRAAHALDQVVAYLAPQSFEGLGQMGGRASVLPLSPRERTFPAPSDARKTRS